MGGSISRENKRSAWDAEVVAGLMSSYPDLTKERIRAEKYWKIYPDVGEDYYFGRSSDGTLYGILANRRNGRFKELTRRVQIFGNPM